MVAILTYTFSSCVPSASLSSLYRGIMRQPQRGSVAIIRLTGGHAGRFQVQVQVPPGSRE
ncbi:hypothetical protein OZD67_02680 [Wolbachia endosymbiont of Drosophila nikananu]|nr:hypothetical protein [Wolbachia endosymbiont of Drosophila nikananu]MDE5061025.1 hypothetical protein [Wolbachia endosymbiont of Drosophila nikananu]